MATPQSTADARAASVSDPFDDPRVMQAVQEYMQQLEAGKRPNRQELLRRYADGQADCTRQVRQALDRSDAATAERLAHTAKGLAANIGAEPLARLAAELEHALREHHAPADVDRCLTAFDAGLQPLVQGLRQVLPG